MLNGAQASFLIAVICSLFPGAPHAGFACGSWVALGFSRVAYPLGLLQRVGSSIQNCAQARFLIAVICSPIAVLLITDY
jgi:hypothetical protein